jgi:gamma-glutamyltranspeptidase / glutathione hydrolase
LNNKPFIITGSSRLHYQGIPNFVITEPYALKTDVFQQLWDLGYRVVPYSSLGVAESIYINPRNGQSVAGNDYRRSNGAALAY